MAGSGLLATRDHVNVFVYDPLVPDPYGIITHGHDNATALLEMLRVVVAHNRAGGWRRLQAHEG